MYLPATEGWPTKGLAVWSLPRYSGHCGLEETSLSERTFDLASFYAQINATAKERNALRQDLVRGLKDYFEAIYGYDRYGAETIFQISERLGQPHVYGYAARRILHDRRISERTKIAVAERALEITEYGEDGGLPFGIYGILQYLAQNHQLDVDDLRFGLVVSAGEYNPFRGVDKPEVLGFFQWLLLHPDLPPVERAFWAHSLIARHQDQPGTGDLVNALLGCEALFLEDRRELCHAWINFRQPRLSVDVAGSRDSPRAAFVADHMGFWIAHAPSWPSANMVRLGLVWLARLEGNPTQLATKYMTYRDIYAEQLHGAVAEIIAEHHASMPHQEVKRLIEMGISMSGSIVTRRKFYRLGTELFGPEYLRRATEDTANSVRQWAMKQLQNQP